MQELDTVAERAGLQRFEKVLYFYVGVRAAACAREASGVGCSSLHVRCLAFCCFIRLEHACAVRMAESVSKQRYERTEK